MVLSASRREALVSRRIDSSSAVPMTGICTLSSNEPDAPPHAMVASLPMTRAHTMSTASGMTGLTLPGMIDEPGWRSGMLQLAEPGVRARAHPAQVVADLREAHGDGAQRSGCLDEAVAVGLRLEVVGGLGDRQLGLELQRAR